MKEIPLTQGYVALVDDADFEAVNAFKWHAAIKGGCVYATRNIRTLNGKQTRQRIHQFLFPRAEEIDHKDGDGLNNQRHNLRPCSHQQNSSAFQRKRPGTSLFRGVSWHASSQKWQAKIMNRYLGLFVDESDAARAYDTAAYKFFGEFAAPNFPVKRRGQNNKTKIVKS